MGQLDVLIAFITTHEPLHPKTKSPMHVVTAAKGLRPRYVYLLYTDSTVSQMQKTREYLQTDRDLSGIQIPDWPKLPLPDVTDYERLADVIPAELKKIRKQRRGANFHLVSGLAQPRMIFALSLNAAVLDGILWEVNPPRVGDPEPSTPEQYLQLRMEPLNLEVIQRFRRIHEEQLKEVRLRFVVNQHEVVIDGHRLRLRRRMPYVRADHMEQGDLEARTFELLLLLAAKKRFGVADDVLSKADIRETIYRSQTAPNAAVNIRRAICSINRRVAEMTLQSSRPLQPLIVDVKEKGRHVGCYRLSDSLRPAEETIEFQGDLLGYLKDRFAGRSSSHLLKLLPDLR